jgi:hypothetical protein
MQATDAALAVAKESRSYRQSVADGVLVKGNKMAAEKNLRILLICCSATRSLSERQLGGGLTYGAIGYDVNAVWDDMGTPGVPCVPLGTWWDDRVKEDENGVIRVSPLCPTTTSPVNGNARTTVATVVQARTTTTAASGNVEIRIPEGTVSNGCCANERWKGNFVNRGNFGRN